MIQLNTKGLNFNVRKEIVLWHTRLPADAMVAAGVSLLARKMLSDAAGVHT